MFCKLLRCSFRVYRPNCIRFVSPPPISPNSCRRQFAQFMPQRNRRIPRRRDSPKSPNQPNCRPKPKSTDSRHSPEDHSCGSRNLTVSYRQITIKSPTIPRPQPDHSRVGRNLIAAPPLAAGGKSVLNVFPRCNEESHRTAEGRNLHKQKRQRRLKFAAGGKSIEYFCGCNESDGDSADTDSDSGDSDGCSGDSDDCSDDSDNCSNKTEEHSDWTEEHKQWSFATNFTVYGCPTRRSNHPNHRSSHPNHRNRRPTRQNLDNSEVSHQNFTVIYPTHACARRAKRRIFCDFGGELCIIVVDGAQASFFKQPIERENHAKNNQNRNF